MNQSRQGRSFDRIITVEYRADRRGRELVHTCPVPLRELVNREKLNVPIGANNPCEPYFVIALASLKVIHGITSLPLVTSPLLLHLYIDSLDPEVVGMSSN